MDSIFGVSPASTHPLGFRGSFTIGFLRTSVLVHGETGSRPKQPPLLQPLQTGLPFGWEWEAGWGYHVKEREMKRRTPMLGPLLLAVALVVCSLVAEGRVGHAEDFSSTDLQLLHTPFLDRNDPDLGNGIFTNNNQLYAARLEHFGTWKYGDNFICIDLTEGKQVGGAGAGSFGANSGEQLFLVYVPRVSVTKVMDRPLKGFVKDLYLAGRLERASYGNYKAENVGVSVDLKVPGTVFFEQDFYARRTNYDKGAEFLSRTVWLAPFSVGTVGLHFDGLALVKTTDNGANVFTQLDFLADLLHKGQLQAGIRLESAYYKHYDRNTPYFMVKWVF